MKFLILSSIVIFSLIGIVGVQESFATAPGVPIPHDQKIILSKIPKLGETATISVIINLKPEFSQLQGNSTQKITLENGFSFVNIDASLLTLNPKTNLLSYSKSLPVVMNVPTVFEFEITPTKVGTWSVHVDGGNYKHRPSFDFIVNDNETILDGKSSTMKFSMIEFPESIISESLSSPISSEMSLSNIPKLGETAQITITTKILSEIYNYPTFKIGLGISPGFELIDAADFIFDEEYTKNHGTNQVFTNEILISDSDQIQTITSVVTIKAVQTGNWRLTAPLSSLNVAVGEDESFLVDFFPSPPNSYPNPVSEPPPKPITANLSPKKQLESGITPENIICKGGLELIFKSDNSPACVKPSTAEKLVQRGWVVKQLDTSSCIDIVAERKNTGIPFELPSKLPPNFQLVDVEKHPIVEILTLSFSSDDCGVRTNLHDGELEVRASLKTETFDDLEYENATKSRLLSFPRNDHYEFFKINGYFAWGYEPDIYPGRVSFTGDNVNMFYTLRGYHTLFVLKMMAESFGLENNVEDIPREYLISPKECTEQGGYYNHCYPCGENIHCEPCMEYCSVG